MSTTRPIRVVVAKPGLDGHDVGAKVLCRALMDAGMEVTYTGLRKSPRDIARVAVDTGADVVGLSMLSGAHLALACKVVDELGKAGAKDVMVIAGGNIPEADHEAMKEAGVAGVFSTGSSLDDIVDFLRKGVQR
jgi:methylmalonyl-CoA mutase C-terminal domain/subunit